MIKEILSEIEKYDTIIMHRHVQGDGDAYGSSVGLKRWIKLNYPSKKVYVVGKDVDYLKKFATMDKISDEVYQNALVIVTDCGNVERIDDQRYQLADKLIKIDHHPNLTPYGDLSWVDTSFTSASEMVGLLIKTANKKIDQSIAQIIYLGIVTDSLRFGIGSTTSRTFEIAAYLTSTNFDLNELYNELYNNNLDSLKAKSELIANMKLDNRVGSIYLTKEIMEKYHIPYSQNGAYSNLLKDIDGIDIWVTFALNEDQSWRVEFRSKGTAINPVAVKWGGGGHRQASGAVIQNLEDSAKIIEDLKQLIVN